MDDCILYGQLFIDFRWFFYIPSLEILSLEKDFWLNELVDILVAEVIEDPVDGHDDQEISGDIQPKSEKTLPTWLYKLRIFTHFTACNVCLIVKADRKS